MATRQRSQYRFEPLTMSWSEVADAVFRRSESWLRSNLPADFPRADATYDLFAREAVEAWVRKRWGIASPTEGADDVTDRLIAKLGRGKHQDQTPRRSAA